MTKRQMHYAYAVAALPGMVVSLIVMGFGVYYLPDMEGNRALIALILYGIVLTLIHIVTRRRVEATKQRLLRMRRNG